MRTALSLLLLLAPVAGAQTVRTADLEGRFRVEVTSTNVNRRFQADAVLDVSSSGRIRLDLDRDRVRMARIGQTLVGRIPAPPGLAGALSGAAHNGDVTITLHIRGRDLLEGTLRSVRERTVVALRRVGPTDPAALLERARTFVLGNAGPGKLLPGLGSGQDGLHAALLDGAPGARLVDFTKAWLGNTSASVRAFVLDATRDVIVAVRTSEASPRLFPVVLDRATGAGRLLGELRLADLAHELDSATLNRILPGIGPVHLADPAVVLRRLEQGGVVVDVSATFFALRYWGAPARPVRSFASEQEWRAWYDSPGGATGEWLFLHSQTADTATFVLGTNDLWSQEIRVTRATGAIELVGEH